VTAKRAQKPGAKPRLRTRAGVDLVRLEEYAELYAAPEDAAALLGIEADALKALLDDPATPHARIWKQARARARLAVRRAQFAQVEKNATLAVYLGKEMLGQDGGGPPAPVTFIVDTGIRRDA